MGYPAEPVDDAQNAWTSALASSSGPRETILYIHIPFCRTRCSFCPFYYGSATDEERKGYVELLAEELTHWGKSFSQGIINTVYFGGGTPSDLTPEELEILLKALHRKYPLANDCEITLESRVDGLTDEKIDAALSNGVNRFSVGVQTFHTDLRRSLGRTSDRNTVLETLGRLTARNQASVTVDILYGLPGQTEEMVSNDLDTLLRETSLSGFSFYRLHLHDRLQLAREISEKKRPPAADDSECFSRFELCEKKMDTAGVRRISCKHYAFHPRERNLHNEISAWKAPCLPFGMNAGGRIGAFRFKQTGDPGDYRKMVRSGIKPLSSAGRLPGDFTVCARIAGQLNCRMSLDMDFTLEEVPEKKKERVRYALEPILSGMESKGIFTKTESGFRLLTSLGRFYYSETAGALMEAAAEAWDEKS